jgi:hypothetical protein
VNSGSARTSFGKIALALVVASGAALLLGNVIVAAVSGAAAAAFGILALARRAPAPSYRPVPTSADVSTPSKMRVKPIVKLREEVMGMIDSHRTNPVVSAMAFDTRNEVDSIVLRSLDILEAKRSLQRLTSTVFPSRAAVGALEDKLRRSTDAAARTSVEQALNTRREELRILEELEAEMSRLDANLDEAEAALAELRTQILKVVAANPERQAKEELDPLSGMTERLRTISSTMEESVEMVTTRIGDH